MRGVRPLWKTVNFPAFWGAGPPLGLAMDYLYTYIYTYINIQYIYIYMFRSFVFFVSVGISLEHGKDFTSCWCHLFLLWTAETWVIVTHVGCVMFVNFVSIVHYAMMLEMLEAVSATQSGHSTGFRLRSFQFSTLKVTCVHDESMIDCWRNVCWAREELGPQAALCWAPGATAGNFGCGFLDVLTCFYKVWGTKKSKLVSYYIPQFIQGFPTASSKL